MRLAAALPAIALMMAPVAVSAQSIVGGTQAVTAEPERQSYTANQIAKLWELGYRAVAAR